MEGLLDPNGIWDLEVHPMGDGGYLEYYGYTIRKKKQEAYDEAESA